MKKTFKISLLLAAVFSFAAFSQVNAQISRTPSKSTTTTTTSSNTSTTVSVLPSMESLVKSWQDAYNREDAKAMAGLITDKVTIVSPDGTTAIETKDEVKYNLENDFLTHDERIVLHVDNAIVMPDGKVRVVGTYTSTEVDPKTGVITTETGIFDDQATKSGTTWKLSQFEEVPAIPERH